MTPAERLNQFIAEGRIVRAKQHGLWRGNDEQGRETATLLAAFAEGIDDASKLPAEIMPKWLVYLTIQFNESGSAEAWPEIIRRYGAAALRWHVLDDSAWRRCLAKTMIAALRLAGQNDKSGSVYDVRAMWMRVAVNDEPSGQQWSAGANKARAAWAAISGVKTKVAELTPLEWFTTLVTTKTPAEAEPAMAAMRVAETGPVSRMGQAMCGR